MQIIEPTSWRAQPWRNGAGVTHELVRWPDLDDGSFEIRISVAEITAPTPFSAFAGYQRWLYLLDGGPVTLALEDRDVVLSEPGDGLSFAGEARVAAAVVAQPSRDLNFMVRDTLPARVELLRGGAHVLAGAAVAVFAVAGKSVVIAGSERRTLARHGCAWGMGERVAVELAADAIAAALVIQPG
jgi:uncharacterized protein